MANLYLNDGWVNPDNLVHNKAPFVVAVGGRGIGKTFAVISELLRLREPFIYLRLSQTKIDACKIQALSPFTEIANVLGLEIKSRSLSKQVAGFFRCECEREDLCAIGIALSTFSNVRGFDASPFNYVLFDEFIPEKHERPIPHESEAFLNIVETINRNREIIGRPAAKFIMLSNSNKLDSPILSAIGALRPLDRMILTGNDRASFYDGALEIFRYMDSPISRRKRDTALYKICAVKDFADMALNNSFGEEAYRNVESRPIQEYRAIASARGITVYRHKSNRSYYVAGGEKAENRFTDTPEQLREFRRRTVSSYDAHCKERVYFSTAEAKVIFENLWR